MEDKKQRQTINALYWMLIISSILSFIPNAPAQLFSLTMITVVLLAAYFYKNRDQADGLIYNHMTYMIGTIWLSTTLLLFGIMAAGLWVYSSGDSSAIRNAALQIQNGIMPDEAQIHAIGMQYIDDNKTLLIISSIVFVGPGIAYFVYRVANGFSRAINGYKVANSKSWL